MSLRNKSDEADAPTRRLLPALEALGDSAWLLRFGERLDPGLNAVVHRWARRLRAAFVGREFELVPAFASLAVHFDPARVATDFVGAELEAAIARYAGADAVADEPHRDGAALGTHSLTGEQTNAIPRTHEIPVAYGGEFGPDLADVASHAGLDPDEVVRRHAATEFQVAMLGFQPGFPYLLGLDPALAMPRLANPRARVPAGSVGIGGAQCGIYPRATPGGWRLIGRTAAVLFDPTRDPPALLAAGDRVRFRAVRAGSMPR